MKFTIIHPTRRCGQAYNTFRNWTEKAADLNNFTYVMSVDYDDPYISYYSAFKYSPAVDFFICTNQNNSAIEAINYAAQHHFKNDVLIVVSDDSDCPEHWDLLLLKELEGKTDFCAKTNDGLQPTLITMPIMDRIYYDRYGYVYHPDYLHMHCDEELTCVALMTGKYIKLPITFLHNHYTTGRTQKDALNDKNNSTWGQGQRTLDRHAENNFGIENPVMRREDIKWK